MGIYPTEKFEQRGDLLYRTYNDFSGAVWTGVYQLIVEVENRTDCYCCSCGDREGSDAACRNHGYWGKRPCEVHNMPGSEWEDEPGHMPASVQYKRFRDRWAEEQWEQLHPAATLKERRSIWPCVDADPHSHWRPKVDPVPEQ